MRNYVGKAPIAEEAFLFISKEWVPPIFDSVGEVIIRDPSKTGQTAAD